METTEILHCCGHPLVSASHPTTFEITVEDRLTEQGHCIIGVGADKGAAGLSAGFKQVICHGDATLTTTLSCHGITVEVRSKGSAAMTLDHPRDFVWRKGSFVCGRTIGICSDMVAATLPVALVENLRAGHGMTVTMTARRPG